MDIVSYSEDQRDCLQEICNVAMGQAGDALARYVGVFVTLSIPVIKIVKASDFTAALGHYQDDDHIYAASQLFASTQHGSDLSGLGLVILTENDLQDLHKLSKNSLSDQDLITSACRYLAQTCLDALSDQWGLGFQCQQPEIVAGDKVGGVCDSLTATWRQVLMVEINYQLEGYQFNGDLLLLFPDAAINAMAERLDALLA